MRKAKPYVDPRQEKLWPDMEHDEGITWKEKKHEDFFRHINLNFGRQHIQIIGGAHVVDYEAPSLSFRDLEEMAFRLPPMMDRSGELILDSYRINPFVQRYGLMQLYPTLNSWESMDAAIEERNNNDRE